MFTKFLTITLAYLTSFSLCLSPEDTSCINKYTTTLSNDFLIGTWYEVYWLADWVIAKPSPVCKRQIFYKMDADQMEITKFMFKILNLPKLKNPIYAEDSHNASFGVLSGSMEGKMFIRDPKHLNWVADNTEGRIYKYVNDNMVLYQVCGNFANKWYLLSRNSDVDSEQVKTILSDNSEVSGLKKCQLCAKNLD